jgi:hypothetical protein
MFTDAFHPQAKTNAVLAKAILGALVDGRVIVDGRAIPTLAAGSDAPAIARARRAIDGIADRTEVYGDRQLQLSVYREDYKKAVEIAKRRPLKDLLWLELMYLGYAQGKLGLGPETRQTYLVLRDKMLGGGGAARARKLENDADVVRYVFDGDLFSDF